MKQKLARAFSLAVFVTGMAAFFLVSVLNAEEAACKCPPGGPMQPCCVCGCNAPPQ
jgi:hypothetical protein